MSLMLITLNKSYQNMFKLKQEGHYGPDLLTWAKISFERVGMNSMKNLLF